MARRAAMLPASMFLVQAVMVGMLLLSKLALSAGMSPIVLTVYRNIFAAAAVAPFALVFERQLLKKINWAVLAWTTANATFGVSLAMGLYYYGLRNTSAAYSAIFLNLVPIVTFIIAVLLRSEKLALQKWFGRMKLLGALFCFGGTLLVSLLKGPVLHLWPTGLLKGHHVSVPASTAAHHQNKVIVGTLFLCASCVAYSLWLIIQARLVKIFPSKYWTTVLTCLIGSIECCVVGFCLDHDKADWKLKWNLQLLTISYSGVLNTGVMFVLISWVISKRGPIYPPMFNSVFLIVSTVLDSLLLGTDIYVGTVVGTVLIVLGLYGFLWGKGEELKVAAAARAQQEAAAAEQEQPLGMV
ncbi:unnamed protein product [Urochloa decumbens]|uniref:WAT1-related protein n=1 Tax=Urochloa decumbens TaxID=240449 RepID=A0ABC8W306_9POAL